MEFRPFGVDEHGRKIRDVTGVKVDAYTTFLSETVSRKRGPQAGQQIINQLCQLLNERIPDPAYHVTPNFLKNVWNSYSYEFVSFLSEFCIILSEDQQFQFHTGKAKFISPLIQTLGRPFTMPQIYKMFPHFGQKFAKDSIQFGVGTVTKNSAVLRMKYFDQIYEQFGPYRKRCAEQICQASKAALAAVPEHIHHLGYATIKDLQCIANGDEWCEWEFVWVPAEQVPFGWSLWGIMAGLGAFVYLQQMHPSVSFVESFLIALAPPSISWFVMSRRQEKDTLRREALIQEQMETLEHRHEELREAYLEQEQVTVELHQKMDQLTTLHRAGLLFSSTLDRETLVQKVLDTLTSELHFERALIAFYDQDRCIANHIRIVGVPTETANHLRSIEIPISDPTSLEGTTLIQGKPVLIEHMRESEFGSQLHQVNQHVELGAMVNTMLAVPLKVKDRVIGCLIVDRVHGHPLTSDHLDVMGTFASQVAVALDNTEAYHQIETLNVNLEERVRQRTAELEVANEELKKLDRLKSQFLAHVSHELRSPLTSIKGFAENLLVGVTGTITKQQEHYLQRIQANSGRLTRMIANLLDRAKLEAGKMEICCDHFPITQIAKDVIEQLTPVATANSQTFTLKSPHHNLMVYADTDKVHQVMTNLIENAIKYSPEGGSILVKIDLHGPHQVRISIIDTGEGIPPEALPSLFTPFFRVKRDQGMTVQGLGLGLSIVKQLVELQGGALSVESEKGKGSKFHFTLPVGQAHQPPTPVDPSKCCRILVVDDDPDIQQFLLDRLRLDGYSAEPAMNGYSALEFLQQHIFDGVILDIGLPDMSGLTVLKDIRKKQPNLPIIMVTATEAEERAQSALNLGANGYLLKPFDPLKFKHLTGQCFGTPKEPVQTDQPAQNTTDPQTI